MNLFREESHGSAARRIEGETFVDYERPANIATLIGLVALAGFSLLSIFLPYSVTARARLTDMSDAGFEATLLKAVPRLENGQKIALFCRTDGEVVLLSGRIASPSRDTSDARVELSNSRIAAKWARLRGNEALSAAEANCYKCRSQDCFVEIERRSVFNWLFRPARSAVAQ